MLKILLLGKTGQLGWELNRTLAPTGDLLSLDYPQVDFTNISALQKKVIEWRPQIIINAAAYTDVDKAESEVELAHTINANAPGALAETAQKLGAAFVHYSTDYVFDGTKMEAYVETDITNPLGIYGKSKLAGEQAVEQVGGAYLILRTSWLYSLRCESFVTKVLRWSRQNQKLRIVTDQVGNPTWSRMLAEISAQMLAKAGEDVSTWIKDRQGIYHLAGDGHTSRLAWAKAILRYDPNREEQITKEIQAAQTSDFPTSAQRPLYSALNCERFSEVFKLRLPDWEAVLQMALQKA